MSSFTICWICVDVYVSVIYSFHITIEKSVQFISIKLWTQVVYLWIKNVLQEWHAYIGTVVQFHVLRGIFSLSRNHNRSSTRKGCQYMLGHFHLTWFLTSTYYFSFLHIGTLKIMHGFITLQWSKLDFDQRIASKWHDVKTTHVPSSLDFPFNLTI